MRTGYGVLIPHAAFLCETSQSSVPCCTKTGPPCSVKGNDSTWYSVYPENCQMEYRRPCSARVLQRLSYLDFGYKITLFGLHFLFRKMKENGITEYCGGTLLRPVLHVGPRQVGLVVPVSHHSSKNHTWHPRCRDLAMSYMPLERRIAFPTHRQKRCWLRDLHD